MNDQPPSFQDAVHRSEPSPDTLLKALSELKARGQVGRVIQECLRALKRHPRDLPLRKLLADSYLAGGFLSQAETEYSRIASDLDGLALIYKDLAQLYARQRRPAELAEAARRYLAHWPEDREVPALLAGAQQPGLSEEQGSAPDLTGLATPTLAEIYRSQGQIREAVRTYQAVLKTNPTDETSRRRLDELNAGLAPKPADPGGGRAGGRRTARDRLARVLGSWLQKVREPVHGGPS